MKTITETTAETTCATDFDLIGRIARGEDSDGNSLGELFSRYNISLRIYLLSNSLSNESNVDDILQSTWAHLMQMKEENFDPSKGAFSTWLHTVTARVARNYHRRLRRLKRGGYIKHYSLDEIPAEIGEPSFDCRVGERPYGPVDIAMAKEVCKLVKEALEDLPIKGRNAIEMVYIKGQTFRVAAQRVGMSRGTLEYRCRVARKTIAYHLSEV